MEEPLPKIPTVSSSPTAFVTGNEAPKNNRLLLLLAVIILLLIGLFGLSFYPGFSAFSPEPSPVTEKTFTNAAFSFAYPLYFPDLVLQQTDYQIAGEPAGYYGTAYTIDVANSVSLQIYGPYTNGEHLDIEDWLRARNGGRLELPQFTNLVANATRPVPGIYAIAGQPSEDQGPRLYEIYVSKESEIYLVRYRIATSDDLAPKYQQDFKSILESVTLVP